MAGEGGKEGEETRAAPRFLTEELREQGEEQMWGGGMYGLGYQLVSGDLTHG